MNVATPREWRVIVGNHNYFSMCSDPMRKNLQSHIAHQLRHPKGGNRNGSTTQEYRAGRSI